MCFLCISACFVIKVFGSSLIGIVFSHLFFFLVYRLFIMLRRFPIESKGRRKKLHEVVIVHVHRCLSSIETSTQNIIDLLQIRCVSSRLAFVI